MITCEVNHARFDAAMDSMVESLGADNVTLLIMQARLLATTIVNFVPPPKSVGPPLTVGRAAVARDINRLVSEASPGLIDSVASEYGLTNVDGYRVLGKGKPPTHLLWQNIDWDGSKLPALHNRYRNRYGGIDAKKGSPNGEWNSRVVVPTGILKNYTPKVMDRVGTAKAYWAFLIAGEPFNAVFPTYITRHFGRIAGKVTANANFSGPNPTVTFGGPAPAGTDPSKSKVDVRRQVALALKIRAKAMMDEIKLILSGYNKDIAAGIRPKKHANDNATPQEVVA